MEEKYKIVAQIGKGGMSVVYLAVDIRLHKKWAVKEIKKKDKRSAIGSFNEILLLKSLEHPCIPRIVDMLEYQDSICIIMDYVTGETLAQKVKKQGVQPERKVVKWAEQICEFLSYLHGHDIVYCDMKPANIMITQEGNIRIIDFGAALCNQRGEGKGVSIWGTAGYAAPEQYDGTADERSDIYALGRTLLALLAGREWTGREEEPHKLLQSVKMSQVMAEVIRKSTSTHPQMRYQTCVEMMSALKQAGQVTGELSAQRKQHEKQRKKRIRVYGFLIALLMGSGIFFVLAVRIAKDHQYQSWISISKATDLQEKLWYYQQAISLCPERTEAYLCLVEAYEEAGEWGANASRLFLDLYNENKNLFDRDTEGYVELNYKVGRMYFHYDTKEDKADCFADRVQKAYFFFAENHNSSQTQKSGRYGKPSEMYYEICRFYKDYVFLSVDTAEPSREDYEKILHNIQTEWDSIQSFEAYDQLALYHGILIFLYDQRKSLAQIKAEKETVFRILGNLQLRVEQLEVFRESSVKVKQEILDSYLPYREAIWHSYEIINARQTTQ